MVPLPSLLADFRSARGCQSQEGEHAQRLVQRASSQSKPFEHSSLRKVSRPAQIHGGFSFALGHAGCARAVAPAWSTTKWCTCAGWCCGALPFRTCAAFVCAGLPWLAALAPVHAHPSVQKSFESHFHASLHLCVRHLLSPQKFEPRQPRTRLACSTIPASLCSNLKPLTLSHHPASLI